MGIAGVKYKIMPSSPEINLKELEEKIKKVIKKNQGENVSFVEEPIAFGLKAIIATFQCSEEKDLNQMESSLEKIENVNSIQMIDIRKIG
ncbi:MAG: elongation factor 1-beta [Candidatus Pacearchaeota archaeon]|jgi:translation elongation factor aEF-1 beta